MPTPIPPMRPSQATRSHWAAVGLLLWAAALRIWQIGSQSLWSDEGNSVWMIRRTWGEIWQAAAADIHPPLYYILINSWGKLLGSSELAVRLLSAWAGIIGLAAAYWLARRRVGTPGALLALAFLGAHPALLYYAQEARMYSLVVCWLMLAWVAATAFATRPTPHTVCAYLACAAAALYTHYAAIFGLLALNLAQGLALRSQPPLLKRWCGLQLLLGLSYLPWLPTAFQQIRQWPPNDPSSIVAPSILWEWLWLGPLQKATPLPNWLQLLGLGGVLLALASTLLRWAKHQAQPSPWWVAAALPPVLLIASQRLSETTLKFALVSVPFVGLALSSSMAWGRPRWRKLLWGTFVAACIAWGGWNAQQLATQPALQRDNYKAIAHFIQQQPAGQTATLLVAPNQLEVYAYYQNDLRDIYPLPRTRPADPIALQAELTTIAQRYKRVSVIFWASAQADPNGSIESWLNEHLFKGSERWVGNLRWVQYAAPLPADHPITPVQQRFGDLITLESVAYSTGTLKAGDILALRLVWQAVKPLPVAYKTFVHLYADINQPPVAQLDRTPNLSTAAATSDQYGLQLPPTLPSGSYRLAVGWYNPNTGERLLLADGQDRLFIAEITIP